MCVRVCTYTHILNKIVKTCVKLTFLIFKLRGKLNKFKYNERSMADVR